MLTTTEDQGAVRILRFNRPDALNAFNSAMFDAVAEDLLATADNDAIKVLIGAKITGFLWAGFVVRALRFFGLAKLPLAPSEAQPREHTE